MWRTLRKPYLLRFKGPEIFAHTLFVAAMFACITALMRHPGVDAGLPRVVLQHAVLALFVTLSTYIPLRLAYRPIQRLPLFAAILFTLAVAAAVPLAMVSIGAVDRLYAAYSMTGASAASGQTDGLRLALITMLGYGLVIQVAVSSRRERMARHMNVSNRMKALQARIRPHFFFNTLNSVAGLIRSDPESAEKAIEDLADIFRVVIKSDKKMVSLAEEIEIARQYLRIETLRLGDRMSIEWNTSDDALNARIPSLTLQPLLENAVYHGIEPNLKGGTITIDCSCNDDRLHIVISNPVPEVRSTRESGNKMALKNIQERLRRQFGRDVRINVRNTLARFSVSINAPLIKAR
mgnify:CR=1 FL=1